MGFKVVLILVFGLKRIRNYKGVLVNASRFSPTKMDEKVTGRVHGLGKLSKFFPSGTCIFSKKLIFNNIQLLQLYYYVHIHLYDCHWFGTCALF